MQEYPVVIHCNACGARFRFDRVLIAGYRAVRFRCRRCGHPMVASASASPPVNRGIDVPGLRVNPGKPPAAPSAEAFPPGSGIQIAVRPARSATMASPVPEETQATDPKPGNLVDLRRIRESYRFRNLSGGQDISKKISPEIPASTTPFACTEADLPAAGTAGRIPMETPESTRHGFPEEVFVWREPDPPKRSIAFHAIKFTLLFTAIGTAAAYLVFRLILAIASWAIG